MQIVIKSCFLEKKKKEKKNIINLLSAELAQRVVKVNTIFTLGIQMDMFKFLGQVWWGVKKPKYLAQL